MLDCVSAAYDAVLLLSFGGPEAPDEVRPFLENVTRGRGVPPERLETGCCGLAGNFGFEAGHGEISRAIAEQALLPRLRDAPADAVVLADGFSCRTQIAEFGDGRHQAIHLAELLASATPAPRG